MYRNTRMSQNKLRTSTFEAESHNADTPVGYVVLPAQGIDMRALRIDSTNKPLPVSRTSDVIFHF